tara:strand:+ start:6968 stop:7564 length:597 start_codon:yes stop_codon:yes gene_type:complete
MKNKKLLQFLVLLHIVIITLSNFLVSIPTEILGVKLTLAAFSFPLVVVATDLTVRLVGKSIARKTISFAFPFAIISSFLIIYYEQNIFSIALRISFASSIAYAISILIDINAFQYFREKYSYWWVAPSLSTFVSNIIDTYSFFFTAFYNSDDVYMSINWLEIATNQLIIKIIIGLIFFLPLYGLMLNYLKKRISIKKN